MSESKTLKETESYTFRSYFEFNTEADEILAELGYQFVVTRLDLPDSEPLPDIEPLQQRLERSLHLTRLSSETACREVLIAPILLAIADRCNAKLRIEYTLNVNAWLQGTLDYFLQTTPYLLITYAKNGDLTRGFMQLSAQLIALADDRDLPTLYGAVTTGELWRFGKLDRDRHTIHQDIDLYTVPNQVDRLTRILTGILI